MDRWMKLPTHSIAPPTSAYGPQAVSYSPSTPVTAPRWRIVDGVATMVLDHWRQFLDLVLQDEMLPYEAIWRGQKRDLPLKPSLERTLHVTDDRWPSIAAEQLRRFKIAIAGRRGLNPRNLDGVSGVDEEDDEWWALGQQNGLKTPLLDWTDFPFAALFFAFIDDSAGDVMAEADEGNASYRVIYALSPARLHVRRMELARARSRSGTGFDERVAIRWIRIIRPHTDENMSLLSQGGLFTQAPPGRDIEGFIREQFPGERSRPPLMKILIRDDSVGPCLMALNRMAINHRTLFPDLYGASWFVNMSIEVPEY